MRGWGIERAVTVLAVIAVAAMLSSCAPVSAYSRRNAEAMCASLHTCVVYDDTGKHLSPCWDAEGRKPTVYPGDPGWPFEPGVCPPTSPASEPPG